MVDVDKREGLPESLLPPVTTCHQTSMSTLRRSGLQKDVLNIYRRFDVFVRTDELDH